MANECENKLAVCGCIEDVLQFQSDASNERNEFTIELLLPKPDGLSTQELGLWRQGINEAFDTDMQWSQSALVCYFNTRWNSPIEEIQAVAAAYPLLRLGLAYQEEGGVFQGVAICRNRDTLLNVLLPYNPKEDDDREFGIDGSHLYEEIEDIMQAWTDRGDDAVVAVGAYLSSYIQSISNTSTASEAADRSETVPPYLIGRLCLLKYPLKEASRASPSLRGTEGSIPTVDSP